MCCRIFNRRSSGTDSSSRSSLSCCQQRSAIGTSILFTDWDSSKCLYKVSYYSSHGKIVDFGAGLHKHATIVIHGAGGNADDYFCSMLSVVNESSVVIALHFLSINAPNEESFLMWNKTDVFHGDNPWRYGAEAIGTDISSFRVLDNFVDALVARGIKRISVAGHSAGGQFVQRWSLLTNHTVRAVVANPSSYVFLTRKRLEERSQRWRVPTHCDNYNHWPWGIDIHVNATRSVLPKYVERVLSQISTSSLLQRLKDRDMQ